MSTIDGVGGPGPIQSGRRSGPAARGGGFSVPAGREAATEAATGSAGASPVLLDAMLTLQEMDAPSERDRSARRHGQSLLVALAALQGAMLAEAADDSGGALDRLAGLLAGMPAAADPGLAGVLAAIRLRARVELARRGR